jgi:hypothetical protein
MFDTTEGPMEIDFVNKELYKQSGDLLCPMTKLVFTDRMWIAEGPDGKSYLIEQRNGEDSDTCFYIVYRIKACNIDRSTGRLLLNDVEIGRTEEYSLDA